jgi:hypothetical protein
MTAEVQSQKISIARQRYGKHVSVVTNNHATEKLMGTIFSLQSVPRLYKVKLFDNPESRVEAGSNTSIVALRVVEGDEKEVSNLIQ